jgi:malate dehydrogenase (quinone)
MLGVIEKCFPDRMNAWRPVLTQMVPSFGTQLSDSPERATSTIASTALALRLAG